MKTVEITVMSLGEDEEAMRFSLPDGTTCDVSLTNLGGGVQLKKAFEAILAMQMDDEVSVCFKKTDGYENGMHVQVCEAYTRSMQQELDQVRELILSEKLQA